jgi:hypothetical protein
LAAEFVHEAVVRLLADRADVEEDSKDDDGRYLGRKTMGTRRWWNFYNPVTACFPSLTYFST